MEQIPEKLTLRWALGVLGPDRVRRGMRAIEDRRAYPHRETVELNRCSTCFVGEAFGGTVDGYALLNATRAERVAAAVVEIAYEEWPDPSLCEDSLRVDGHGVLIPFDAIVEITDRGARAKLRAECIAYLAEHGVAYEPAANRKAATT